MKAYWLAGVAATTILVPAMAAAQQTDTSNLPAVARPAESAQVAGQDGIAEIIVTANKEASNLQKTSGAIATISGASLVQLGISNVQSLTKLVSGLQVEPSGSIFIRGVGSRVLNATGDPAVAFSVDGVYFARPAGTSTTLFDVSRLEVVKGPQGTLYGRNATGGALNVISNHPVIGAQTLDGQVEIGAYHDVRAQVAANLPLGDNAALRIAGQSSHHSGYLNDGYDDEDYQAARVSALFQPSTGLSIYVSGDYANQGGQGTGSIPVGPGSNGNVLTTRFVNPSNPWTGPSDSKINAFVQQTAPTGALSTGNAGIFCPGMPLGPNAVGTPALVNCNFPLGYPQLVRDGYLDNKFYGLNATINADAGLGNLTVIGGYRGSKISSLTHSDPGYHIDTATINQFSAEARLASKPNDGRLKWLIGGFYLHEKQDTYTFVSSQNESRSNPIAIPGSPLPQTVCSGPLNATSCTVQATILQRGLIVASPDIVNETYAGFGQATFSIADTLRIVGGIRYTHELKSETGGIVYGVYTLPAGVVTSFPTQGRISYNNTSYRAGVEFDVAPRSMFYATYATAFHAGGFNLGIAQGPNVYQYQPEKVKYYVTGLKNRFFNNMLQVNVEAYWLDYENYQQQSFGRINDGSVSCSQLLIAATCPFALRTENAATARVRGVEGDIVYVPVRDTTLSVNVLYNDARFRRFSSVSPFGTIVYDGRRIPGTVPWTVTGGVNQVFPLGNGGRLVADARSQYKSGAYLWFSYVPAVYQKGYTRTDLNLTYEAPGNRFSIGGFIRNVENKASLVAGGPNDGTTGAVWTSLNPPRTYGAIVGFHF